MKFFALAVHALVVVSVAWFVKIAMTFSEPSLWFTTFFACSITSFFVWMELDSSPSLRKTWKSTMLERGKRFE
jgi:hypothetical protein